MKESILKEKAMDFAIRIVNLYHFLNDKKQEKVMAKQILRSGTSIGANISEGIYAESTADFIHKHAIAQKECAETLYWLELLKRTQYIDPKQYDSHSHAYSYTNTHTYSYANAHTDSYTDAAPYLRVWCCTDARQPHRYP